MKEFVICMSFTLMKLFTNLLFRRHMIRWNKSWDSSTVKCALRFHILVTFWRFSFR